MPLQRLTGNGMDYADVIALYAAVDDGTAWIRQPRTSATATPNEPARPSKKGTR